METSDVLMKSIATECPYCHCEQIIVVDPAAFDRWKAGEYIQVAFPELTADQREALITGYCGACWDKLFPEEDDE
jgi:hypothetical protein